MERSPSATRKWPPHPTLIAPGGRERVSSMRTTTRPEGDTWATVVGLITLFIGTTAVFGEL